jgi:hypothetical protein
MNAVLDCIDHLMSALKDDDLPTVMRRPGGSLHKLSGEAEALYRDAEALQRKLLAEIGEAQRQEEADALPQPPPYGYGPLFAVCDCTDKAVSAVDCGGDGAEGWR